MIKISWRENKTNEEVLKIIPTIKKRKITYFGHLIRNPQADIGGSLGGTSRGRPRTEWMTNIIQSTGMQYEDLVRMEDREQWRFMTATLLKAKLY